MNPSQFYASFTRIPPMHRLGNLGVTLNRIADGLERHQNRDGTLGFVQEAMWFIEWLGSEVKPEQAELMAHWQHELGKWRHSWERIWDSREDCQAVQEQTRAWSEKVLEWIEIR